MTVNRRFLGLNPAQSLLAAAVVALCAASVAALLADLYDIASMGRFFVIVTIPALVILVAIGTARVPGWSQLQHRMAVGAVAGLVGTIGYDLFRIPFALAGQRVFAPIDSYGLLINGGAMSSPWTDLLGWAFHLSNGITFGIAFAVVAARRHWGYGVAYGLALEAVAFLGPFTSIYGLSGKTWPIIIAFAAHVAYGLPLGLMVERYDATYFWIRNGSRLRVAKAVGIALLVLVVWHRPWVVSDDLETARELSSQEGLPVAVVSADRFDPEWLRVETGGCVLIVSKSDESFTSDYGDLAAGSQTEWCFTEAGVERIKLSDRAYSGGFVYVNDR